MRDVLNYLLVEPFTWLFYCFFQPAKFNLLLDSKGILYRFTPLFRLIVPLFLLSYPLVFIVRLAFLTSIYCCLSPIGLIFHSTLGSLLLATAAAEALGLLIALISGFIGGITLGIALGITVGIAVGSVLGIAQSPLVNMSIGILLSIFGGMLLGILQGYRWGILLGMILGIAWTVAGYFADSFLGGIIFGVAFIGSYLLGYYRLPLYIVSGTSGLKMSHKSRRTPSQVFTYLHRSSLYWDERIYLPLPGLEDTLLIASQQSIEQTLKEITFIVSERPLQSRAAHKASFSIMLSDLESCRSLLDIANASEHVASFVPQDTDVKLVSTQQLVLLGYFNAISQQAHHYCYPESWQAKKEGLDAIQENLAELRRSAGSLENRFSERINTLVERWGRITHLEQEALKKVLGDASLIDNPYNTGPSLEPNASLFVGRQDIIQRLKQALDRGRHHPTFLLQGERRMGKSSVLKQLPLFLGDHQLSILFDLQTTGILSSTVALLSTIAEEICNVLVSNGIDTSRLERIDLEKARESNEAAVYHVFGQWLGSLQGILLQRDWVLLLMFDEFEKLEEARQDGYLNLRLLFNWFRTTIQNRPQLALLFCGTETPAELGADWTSAFVNVQRLKVSFLREEEARHLVLHPVSGFPGKDIFGEEVVDKVIEVTGCHPFLVQAMCEALIDILNDEVRYPTKVEDIPVAVSRVLESWYTYFQDIWQRTTTEQRTCLFAMNGLGKANLQEIMELCGLDEPGIRQTLQKLQERDLVLLENGTYRISTPIFAAWVERNS
jgi:uncharacterized protein